MGMALPIIGAVGGALSGALGNTKAARTTTTNMKSGSSYNNSSSLMRTLLPEQQDIPSILREIGGGLIMNPTSTLEPFATAARNGVNESFSAVQPSLAARYLGTTGTRSGKFGRAARLAETARLSKLSDVGGQVGMMALDRQNQGIGLLQQLLAMNFGQTQNAQGEQNGWQSGTQVGAGSALGGAFGGALAGGLGGYNAWKPNG